MDEEKEKGNEQEKNAQDEVCAQEDREEKKENTDIVIDKAAAQKVVYSLCYLWGILFFLPLILYKDNEQAKRHANEGLVLLLFSVIGNAVFGILSSFMGFFGIIAGVYSVLLLILGIIGIVYVVTDKDEPLPLLGGIRIIK